MTLSVGADTASEYSDGLFMPLRTHAGVSTPSTGSLWLKFHTGMQAWSVLATT